MDGVDADHCVCVAGAQGRVDMSDFKSMTPVAIKARELRGQRCYDDSDTADYIGALEGSVDELEVRLAANYLAFEEMKGVIESLKAEQKLDLIKALHARQ
jgi:hypothetical protein